VLVKIKTKLVNVNITETNLKRLNKIKKNINAENVTSALGASIALSHMVVNALVNGDKVFVQKKDGQINLIKI
jgi:hypothetical protein